ncbi:hypothetical protein GCM10009641_24160 [Mycobacterium cookii]|uniref:DUF732 domain-containing protein n=1 Tax=Mycobacterium cookii TaxID=1775 RepID=A0A7I7KUG7_9MYCO|nr:DUF732 domain-containing protein [Mycobacterium cookii]MCV7331054.1 DUF732 domain-containing protein [Mycobacterium cookii]BBX44992.1 hypothetical protein MCOO_10070 [Mycobacterium cookii]
MRGLAVTTTARHLAAASLAMATGIMGAGLASAGPNGAFSGPEGDHDAAAMFVDINYSVKDLTIAQAGQLGADICTWLANGRSEGDIVAGEVSRGAAVSVSDAQYVVHAAEWHFCPDEY